MSYLLAAFIIVPILEIAAFIQVGTLVGLWPTLALTFATAIAGAAIVRYQGFRTLAALRDSADRGKLPVEPVIHAGFLLVAGLCLLTPGFVTDTVGFVLLVPAARLAIASRLWRYVQGRGDVTIVSSNGSSQRPAARPMQGPVIELEADDISEENPDSSGKRAPSSPWRKNGGPTR